jgi:hypothetical protein
MIQFEKYATTHALERTDGFEMWEFGSDIFATTKGIMEHVYVKIKF